VGYVGDAVTAGEDLVEAAGVVEVRSVKREPPGRVATHRLQEADLGVIVDAAHARPRPVAPIEQRLYDPAANEAGGAGHRDHATLRYCAHLSPVPASSAGAEHRIPVKLDP
jgi:hypothetical protein